MQSNVSPVYPRPFASGTFIDCFSPKEEKEHTLVLNAIKAFKANIVIVVDNKLQERQIS